MKLTRLEAANVLASLTPEESDHVKRRRDEILEAGGHLDEAIRVPVEEVAARRQGGGE